MARPAPKDTPCGRLYPGDPPDLCVEPYGHEKRDPESHHVGRTHGMRWIQTSANRWSLIEAADTGKPKPPPDIQHGSY